MRWFTSGINRILGWLAQAASDRDGTPSSKRIGFLYMVGLTGGTITGLVGALVFVATMLVPEAQAIEVVRSLGDTLVWVVGSGLTAVTGGYIGGKAVERKGAPADAQPN